MTPVRAVTEKVMSRELKFHIVTIAMAQAWWGRLRNRICGHIYFPYIKKKWFTLLCRSLLARARLWCVLRVGGVVGGALSSSPLALCAGQLDKPNRNRPSWFLCLQVCCIVQSVYRMSCGERIRVPTVYCGCVLGIEDGQTVKVPVGKKYIYITFKVSWMAFTKSRVNTVYCLYIYSMNIENGPGTSPHLR